MKYSFNMYNGLTFDVLLLTDKFDVLLLTTSSGHRLLPAGLIATCRNRYMVPLMTTVTACHMIFWCNSMLAIQLARNVVQWRLEASWDGWENFFYHITYHNFPKEKHFVPDTIRKEWIRRCKRADDWNSNMSQICSIHFAESDYEYDMRNETLGNYIINEFSHCRK